jgi:A-macroglobulin TED domain
MNCVIKIVILGSTKVLISSYVAQTYLQVSRPEKVEPIMKWLLLEKDKKGDFHGTYDTIVGLQTICQMAAETSTSLTNLRFKFTNAENVSKTTEISEHDSFVTQHVDMPYGTDQVSLDIEGTGFAIIHQSFYFSMRLDEKFKNFELKIQKNVTQNGGLEVVTCLRYIGVLRRDMDVIMEHQLPSGYVYETSSNPMRQSPLVKVTFACILVLVELI